MFKSVINLFPQLKKQAIDPLSCVEIPSTKAHLYTIIWIHGLGADGEDVYSILPELNLAEKANIRFISPHAPVMDMMTTGERRVTMRSWYDISEIVLNARPDYKGVDRTMMAIHQLIDREIALGVPSRNIVLMGISQGGCIALHTGLCYPQRLGAIVGLSTYLSTIDVLAKKASAANGDVPIFMAHGNKDTAVDIEASKAAFTTLRERNYPIEWREYPIGHHIDRKEMRDVSRFLDGIIGS